MKSILVKARGLSVVMLAPSTCDAIIRAQTMYPHRHGFSASVVKTVKPVAA